MREKGTQIQYTVYITHEQYDKLSKLKKRKGVSIAHLVRRGIDHIIKVTK